MPDKYKVIVTMPAYMAERTLQQTLDHLPRDVIDDIVLVDDASTDGTVEVAQGLGLHVVVHPENRGYGANQKTCYDTALERGADVVVMLHPDYQYDPKMVPDLIAPILTDQADFTFGSRFRGGWRQPFKGKMPLYRWIGNRIATFIENLLIGTDFTEMHSGYRAYSRRVLEAVPYHELSDDFVFDSQMLILAAFSRQFRIQEVAIPTRYDDDSSSVNLAGAFKYIAETLWFLVKAFFRQRRIRDQIAARMAVESYPASSS